MTFQPHSNKTLQKIDVFISSPSDVQAERDAIYQCVTAINEEPSVRERYVLKPLAYERLVPPEVGDKPQKVVDKYMREAGKADLFIGVLWSRMGTPVVDDDGTEYQSGTEYEFRKAYEARTSSRAKPIMLLYRSLQSIPVTADFEQIGRVQAFFKRFEGDAADFKGLYKTYTSLDEFKTLIRQHLLEVLAQINPDADDVQPIIPIRRRADHYQHIPLPTNYVERTDLLTELRKALIGDSSEVALTSALKSTTPLNPTALHGMGGIGKSVMARALCDDPQVHAAFPDGILWATCGQTPNLVQQLRGWIKAFNETPDDKAELDDLKAHAAKLLASRACLLIIDDVWNKAHAQAFRVGGANCRTILTTRDEMIAEELGAKIERIPPMSEPDAINLLELWAKDTLTTVSHADKARVVNRVGRLALAIKLAGGQLIRQSVEDWLKGFDVHKLKSRRPDSTNPHDSLEVCFGLSLSQLAAEDRRLYAALSIFREDEPILERAVSKLWDAYGDADPNTTSDLIDDLGARALLEITTAQYPRAFILHDLLRDFMNSELGSNRTAAHEAIIAAYAETKTGDGWPSAPDDGYLYTHLAYHLHSVGRNEELYALLTDSPAWMEAKFIACIGDRAYVDDLELAISDFHDPLTADQVLRLTKLWTARQVVNARVSLYKDIDLQTLVWMGRVQEAITYATLRSQAKERLNGLLAIIEAQRVHSYPQIKLLEQTILFVRSLEDKDLDARATTLRSVAAAFAHAGRIDEALVTARDIESAYPRADALCDIVATLAHVGRFDEALTIAHNIEPTYSRADALREVATALAKVGRFDEALTIARDIVGANPRAGALREIAASVAQAGQNSIPLFDEALVSARVVKDAFSRMESMRDIAVALAQIGRVDEALTIARAIGEADYRTDALRDIAATLSQTSQTAIDLFDEALISAHAIENIYSRATALAYIAASLAKVGHLDKALTIARNIEEFSSCTITLCTLAQVGHHHEALTIARNIEDISERSIALSAIAATLAKVGQDAGYVLDEALTISRNIEDISERTAAVRDIAVLLAQIGQVDEALNVVGTLDDIDVYHRADAMRDIAAVLANTARVAEALTIARTIEDEYSRAETQRRIAAALAHAGNIDKALSIARTIKGMYSIAHEEALRDIAAALAHAGRIDEALSIAHTIERHDELVDALNHIVAALAHVGRIDEALSITHVIENAGYRVKSLDDIAVAIVQTGRIDEALSLARAIEDTSSRAGVLSTVAIALAQMGHNGTSIFGEALSVARAIEDTPSRATGLCTVAIAQAQAGQYDNNIFDEARTIAHSVEDASARSAILYDIAVSLTQVGSVDKALPLARVIEDASCRAAALRVIAMVLTDNQLVTRALDVLDLGNVPEFLQTLVSWRNGFENIKSGLTLAVLRDATRIIAWEKPQWRDIHAILVKATET